VDGCTDRIKVEPRERSNRSIAWTLFAPRMRMVSAADGMFSEEYRAMAKTTGWAGIQAIKESR
jgi:hypothetical protein